MIFITKDRIVEVSNWFISGIEIFSDQEFFHEILNPLFSTKNNGSKYSSLKDEIERQIIANKYYVDLRPLQNN